MANVPDMDKLTAERREGSKMTDLDEFMAYAEDEGLELTDEQLEAVSGGETADQVDYPDVVCRL